MAPTMSPIRRQWNDAEQCGTMIGTIRNDNRNDPERWIERINVGKEVAPLPTFSFAVLICPVWFVASDGRTVWPVPECRGIQTPASSLLLAASRWRHCISFRWNSHEASLPKCRNWHRKFDRVRSARTTDWWKSVCFHRQQRPWKASGKESFWWRQPCWWLRTARTLRGIEHFPLRWTARHSGSRKGQP